MIRAARRFAAISAIASTGRPSACTVSHLGEQASLCCQRIEPRPSIGNAGLIGVLDVLTPLPRYGHGFDDMGQQEPRLQRLRELRRVIDCGVRRRSEVGSGQDLAVFQRRRRYRALDMWSVPAGGTPSTGVCARRRTRSVVDPTSHFRNESRQAHACPSRSGRSLLAPPLPGSRPMRCRFERRWSSLRSLPQLRATWHRRIREVPARSLPSQGPGRSASWPHPPAEDRRRSARAGGSDAVRREPRPNAGHGVMVQRSPPGREFRAGSIVLVSPLFVKTGHQVTM